MIIQKLHEAMFNEPYMIEKGYAEIKNSEGCMLVVVELVGAIKGYGKVISILTRGS